MFKNVEAKVIASSAGAGAGSAIGAFLLWLLGVTVWTVPDDAQHAAAAVAAVPEPVGGLLVIVVGAAGAYIAGYRAPHTDRPDLTATPMGELVRSQGFAPVEAPAPIEAPAAEPQADSTATAEPLADAPTDTTAAPSDPAPAPQP